MNFIHTVVWFIYRIPLPVVAAIILICPSLWGLIMKLISLKSVKAVRVVNTVLLSLSVFGILYMTLFREPNGSFGMSLMPFRSFYEAKIQREIYRTLLMNILLFTPFGMSLSFVFCFCKKKISVKKSVAFGFELSILIELIQYLFNLGRFETDDVICNVFGVLLGTAAYIAYLGFNKGTAGDVTVIDDRINDIFLDVCSSFVNGSGLKFDDISVEEFESVFAIASRQKLLPAVYFTLKTQERIPDNSVSFDVYKSSSVKQTAGQISKTESFLSAYKNMLDSGLEPLCVKGIVCRSLYRNPDMRPSGDEDIIVNTEDFDLCRSTLINTGYDVIVENEHELSFFNRSNGSKIEVHNSLFPDSSGMYRRFNTVLGNLFENSASVICNGKTVYCPNADKHMLYLVMHAYKHFVNAGVGIRQIMDIAVFAGNYSIDYNRLFDLCVKSGILKFANAVLTVSSEYFGLDKSKYSGCSLYDSETDISPLINDILCGGVYGGGLERRHAASLTAGQGSSRIKTLFPGLHVMKRKYHILNRFPVLLPFFWLKRIVSFMLSGNEVSSILNIGKTRSELLKIYCDGTKY